jgi:multiple sugar transport system permease protein
MAAHQKRGDIFRFLTIAEVLIVTVFPLYWVVATSLKGPREVVLKQPTLFPQEFTLVNFRAVIDAGVGINFFNSLAVTACSTILSIYLGITAGYALVRHRFRLRFNALFLVWVLVVKILPPIVLAVPLYELFLMLNLVNSRIGLIMVYQVYTLPYALWILVGFLRGVPREIEEAAVIDGATQGQILRRIVAPLSAGGIAATAVVTSIMAWDEFLFALLFTRRPRMFTVPLRIVNYITEYETEWGSLMAIGVFASVPLLLLTGVVYERLTTGFATSLK